MVDSGSSCRIDEAPLSGAIQDLGQIELREVSGGTEEPLWNHLMRRHHYLGFNRAVGARLKYLAYSGQRVIAAIGWTAASWRVQVRDCYIGWSESVRKEKLWTIANNNRFLILPWVRVKNLASYLLSRSIHAVVEDWYRRYGHRLLVLESFIDPYKFSAVSYRAANWIYVGETKGYRRTRERVYTRHGQQKEVWLYVVEKDFRCRLGCQQRPVSRVSLRNVLREGKTEMQIRHARWDSPLATVMKITPADMEEMAEELMRFYEQFRHCFSHRESHQVGLIYLRGLMSDVERKTAEGIALALADPHRVRATQSFITSYPWDEQAMMDTYAPLLSAEIADACGVLSVDSSEFRKKGTHSVGVAHQYCGTVGKVDNCQSGVFVGYASRRGYGLVDRHLYMPQEWFEEEYKKTRKACRVPEDLQFATKLQIAVDLIEKTQRGGLFPARWVACDSTFGRDQEFRDAIGAAYWYMAAVPKNTDVWVEQTKKGEPKSKGRKRGRQQDPVEGHTVHLMKVQQIAEHPSIDWHLMKLSEGAKGPVVAEVARVRLWESRDKKLGPECWLFLRRDEDGMIKYALSNAPRELRLREMVRVCMLRWPIEQCFQDGKSYLGMNHYEHRGWLGWHRHMSFVFLAQLFLLKMRNRFKKKAPILTLPQAYKLMKVILASTEGEMSKTRVLENIAYYIRRNEQARISHRKTRLTTLRRRGMRV